MTPDEIAECEAFDAKVESDMLASIAADALPAVARHARWSGIETQAYRDAEAWIRFAGDDAAALALGSGAVILRARHTLP